MVYDILRVTKKKTGFHSLSRKHIFRKSTGGIRFTTSTFLGLRNREFFGVSIYNLRTENLRVVSIFLCGYENMLIK